MSLIPFISISGSGGGAPPTGVQLLSNNFRSQGSGTVYSGVKFDSDGGVYERQPTGGCSRKFSWYLGGVLDNTDYYIVRTIISGSLTTDAGAGPLVLSTDRIYDIQETSDTDMTVSFEIQNLGTDVLASRTYEFIVVTTA